MPYQQSPFKQKWPDTVRGDCEKRFSDILSACGDVTGKTVLDFGCAEGYFGFRFIQEGAGHTTFIDSDKACVDTVKRLAHENMLTNMVTVSTELTNPEHYDITLMLDLWNHNGTVPTVQRLSEFSSKLFISTAGDGTSNNAKLEKELLRVFGNAEEIHTGYKGRTIFMSVR